MTSRPYAEDRLLHSFRVSDRRLFARHGTTARLVRDGVLRAVPWGRGLRIPESELQRLARDGWAEDSAPRAPRPGGGRRRAGFADPGAVRRVRVEDL